MASPQEIGRGFRPLTVVPDSFLAANGPFLGRIEDDVFRIGLEIAPEHANAGGICHGGMMMGVADTQLVIGGMIRLQDSRPLVTINTTFDFIRPGVIGGWLEGSTCVIRSTRNTVFAESLMTVDGETALRASGIFRRSDLPPLELDAFLCDRAEPREVPRGEANPPDGFREVKIPGEFLAVNGPLHLDLTDDHAHLGLRIEDRHCNSSGICHGGALMMLADIQLAVGSKFQTGKLEFMPTIHFACDFLKPVRTGDWLTGRTRVIRQSRNYNFAECILYVDGEPVLRANGINKRTSNSFDFASLETLFV